jgi:hypothetical protein
VYELIVWNEQGASEATKHRTIDAAKKQLRAWADPERLTADIRDEDAVLYHWTGEEWIMPATAAARALRAIPSESRAQASRDNGAKGDPESHRRGGRPKKSHPTIP